MRKKLKKMMAVSLIISLVSVNPVYGASVEDAYSSSGEIVDNNIEDNGIQTTSTPVSDFKYRIDGIEEAAYITEYIGLQSEVIIPDMIDGYPVTSIENSVFSGKKNLEYIVIPDTVTYIGESCFSGCSNLKEVTLSDSLGYIPQKCFNSCISLANIEIPDSVTKIDSYAFSGCTKLQMISFSSNIQTIGESAFSECIALQKIDFSEGIQVIKRSAFSGCTMLDNVVIPDSVTTLESRAFLECTGLQNVKLSNSIKVMSEYVFSGCVNLKEVTWPSGLEKIKSSAFENTGFEETTLPRSVNSIESRAFADCKNLKKIVITGDRVQIGSVWYESDSNPFSGCNNLKYFVAYGDGSYPYLGIPSEANIYGIQSTEAYDYSQKYGFNFYKINAPTGLKLENVDETSVKLTWNSADHINGYKVYRSADPESGFTEIADVTENTYIDTNFNPEELYYYKVCIYYDHDGIVEGIPTNAVEKTPAEPKTPIDSLYITYADSAVYTGNEVTIPVTVKDGEKKLQENVDYQVSYTNNIDIGWATLTLKGIGDYTGTYDIRFEIVEKINIPAPSWIDANAESYNKIVVEWEPVNGAQGYIISRRSDDMDWEYLAEISGNKSSYVDKTVEVGQKYFYTVCVSDGNGTPLSPADTEGVSAKCMLDTPKLSSVKTSGYNALKLTWKKVKGANGYVIYRSTKKKTKYKKVASVKSSKLNYTNKNLAGKKRYYYKIRAYRKVDGEKVYSGYSSVKSAVTKAKTSTSKTIYGTYRSSGGVTITITKENGYNPGGYEYVGIVKSGKWLGVGYLGPGTVNGVYQVLASGSKVIALIRMSAAGISVEERSSIGTSTWYDRIK